MSFVRHFTSPCAISSLIIPTYFALKELIVGNDQLFFLRSLGDVFDVSQQLVLIEELKGKMQSVGESDQMTTLFLHHLWAQINGRFWPFCSRLCKINRTRGRVCSWSDEITSRGLYLNCAPLSCVDITLHCCSIQPSSMLQHKQRLRLVANHAAYCSSERAWTL